MVSIAKNDEITLILHAVSLILLTFAAEFFK